MAWPSARYKTAANGGSWVPGDMNGVQDQYIRATGILDTDLDPTTVSAKLGLDGTGVVRRGKSIIAANESRTNAAYGTLTTADQVQNIVLPTDGLIAIAYQATWQNSVGGAGRAAIFLGANQLKSFVTTDTTPAVNEAFGGSAGTDYLLWSTDELGLTTGGAGYTGDATTGQIVGGYQSAGGVGGGVLYVFAAAGTYTVSVQFKAASGSVSAKNRKLWAWTLGF